MNVRDMNTYLKFLSKNKLYTAIEAFGLSLALGFIILLASYARTEFSVGARQPLSKQLYAIGTEDMVGMTLGTGEEFFPSMPEITSWTRIAVYGDADVTIDGEYYQVKADAIDTNFLRLFDYRIAGCDRNRILAGADEVIVSEDFAKKAFGGEEPVGRTIVFNKKSLTVTGVLQDFGPSDPFSPCDVFLCMNVMDGLVMKMDQFGMVQTLVTLAEGTDPDEVAAKLLDKYCCYWDWFDRDASNGGFLYGSSLTRLDRIYFCDRDVFNPFRKGDKRTVEVLLAVALVLLISAIFNYINLTVAQTGKRSKEMATRRLLGESQSGIVRRYIGESFLFTAGCFVLGCVIAICFRPWMARLLTTEIVLRPDLPAVLCTILLLCVISLISGLLPAVMVSRFKPIDVVKGDFRFRSKMVFSKVFIVCQNVLSTAMIAVALTMTLQMRHLVTLPTGYNTNDMIKLSTWSLGFRNMDAQNELARRLRALPQVEAVGMTVQAPFACGSNGVHIENEKMSWLKVSQLDSTSFRLLGFQVLEKYSEPLEGTYWFTQEAKKRYGVSEKNRTVGKCDDGTPEYECCGIIADYRANDALSRPMEDSHNAVMNRTSLCSCMIVKVTGDRKEAFMAVSDVWRGVAVDYLGVPKAADMNYVDDFLNSALTGTRNTMSLVNTFMILAILISALGLFAMSVYYTDQQSRQIALRKIFGSDVRTAAWTLSKDFIMMAVVAVVIAAPICVWAMRYYLSDFYNAIQFPWWVIPVAALLTLLIAAVSIFGQTWKSAAANPIDKLKTE